MYHGDSVLRAAAAIYPEAGLAVADDATLVQQAYLSIGIKSLKEWYDVSEAHLEQKAPELATHLKKQGLTLYQLLSKVYNQLDWLPWCFKDGSGVPKGYWTDKSTHKKFFDWLAGELGIIQMSQWCA